MILLTVIDSYAPKPYQGYQRPPGVISRLPLGHFRDPLPLAESASTSVSSTAQPLPTSNSPLKDSLFPIANPNRTHGNSWIDENHRQLKALFTCIELDTCGPNQGKGMVLTLRGQSFCARCLAALVKRSRRSPWEIYILSPLALRILNYRRLFLTLIDSFLRLTASGDRTFHSCYFELASFQRSLMGLG